RSRYPRVRGSGSSCLAWSVPLLRVFQWAHGEGARGEHPGQDSDVLIGRMPVGGYFCPPAIWCGQHEDHRCPDCRKSQRSLRRAEDLEVMGSIRAPSVERQCDHPSRMRPSATRLAAGTQRLSFSWLPVVLSAQGRPNASPVPCQKRFKEMLEMHQKSCEAERAGGARLDFCCAKNLESRWDSWIFLSHSS